DLLVGARLDDAARLVARGGGALPARRIADADRGGDRLRRLHDVSEDDGRRAGRLKAHHARRLRDAALRRVFRVALPVRGDVARVADRDAVVVRRAPERVAYLERRRLLTLDPKGVHRVHEREPRGVALLHVADEGERLVEVALDLDDARAVHHRLGELAERDL